MKHTILYSCIIFISLTLISGCVSVRNLERQGIKAYISNNYSVAASKFKEAADQGSARAQYHLAVLYAQGRGVAQDDTMAAELLAQAEQGGSVEAGLMLGLFLIHGKGIAPDPVKGVAKIRAAAEKGNDVAMYYLGQAYAQGIGGQKDSTKALIWFKKAKAAGFPVEDDLLTALQ